VAASADEAGEPARVNELFALHHQLLQNVLAELVDYPRAVMEAVLLCTTKCSYDTN
jgi:hypothetical protein